VADPLDVLTGTDAAVAPDPAFAAALRRRLVAALHPIPPAHLRRSTTMTTATSTVPVTSAAATPYLCVHDAAAAIDFYVAALGAVEVLRIPQPAPDTRLGHAEISVGGARIMLSDEFPEMGVVSPRTLGGSPFQLHVSFTDVDVDALFAQAVAAGATVLRPPADQFYGERAGSILDPFGHRWTLAASIEDLTDEEVVRRAASAPADQGGPEHSP
jgi:PhnB protein